MRDHCILRSQRTATPIPTDAYVRRRSSARPPTLSDKEERSLPLPNNHYGGIATDAIGHAPPRPARGVWAQQGGRSCGHRRRASAAVSMGRRPKWRRSVSARGGRVSGSCTWQVTSSAFGLGEERMSRTTVSRSALRARAQRQRRITTQASGRGQGLRWARPRRPRRRQRQNGVVLRTQ